MLIGFPTHPRREILSEIDWIARHGFQFADVCLEPDLAAAENVDPVAIRAALQAHRLQAVGHMAWYLPIGSAMPQMRQAAIDAAELYLTVFSKIEVRGVTIHADWPSRLFKVEEGVRWQIESLRRVLQITDRLGLRLFYEPVPHKHDSADNIARVLDALPDLCCHLDLGHCNLWGKSPAALIRRFAGRLHHIHMNDNDGVNDLHLPPGTGTVDWPSVFQALRESGYDGTLTLEIFSSDRDYALLARRKVEAALRGEPWPVTLESV